MAQQPTGKLSTGYEAIAVLLAVGAGTGIGYALFLATSNVAVGIGSAATIAHLVNSFVRNVVWKGKT